MLIVSFQNNRNLKEGFFMTLGKKELVNVNISLLKDFKYNTLIWKLFYTV